jgi:hypothetical protein
LAFFRASSSVMYALETSSAAASSFGSATMRRTSASSAARRAACSGLGFSMPTAQSSPAAAAVSSEGVRARRFSAPWASSMHRSRSDVC